MERIFKQLRVECRRRVFLALHSASKAQKLVVPIGGLWVVVQFGRSQQIRP